MYVYFRATALLLLSLALPSAVARAAGPPRPESPDRAAVEELLRHMDAERQKLRSGRVEIAGATRIEFRLGEKLDRVIEGPYLVRCAFDHDKAWWRFDIDMPGAVVDYDTVAPAPGGGRATAKTKMGTVRRRYALRDERATFWAADNAICTIGSDNEANELDHRTYDVRGLGLFEPLSFRQGSYAKILDYWMSLAKFCTLARDGPLTEIVSEVPDVDGVRHRWIIRVDERNGYTPVLQRHDSREPRSPDWTNEYEYRYSWSARDGVQVPTAMNHRYVGRRRVAGGENTHINTLAADLKWSDVNTLDDPDLFTYKTFGLPDHVGIADVTTTGTRYIREPKPDPARPRPVAPPRLVPKQGIRTRLAVMAILSGVFTITAVLLLRYRLRNPPPPAAA